MLCAAQKGWRQFLLQLTFCSFKPQVSRKKKTTQHNKLVSFHIVLFGAAVTFLCVHCTIRTNYVTFSKQPVDLSHYQAEDVLASSFPFQKENLSYAACL